MVLSPWLFLWATLGSHACLVWGVDLPLHLCSLVASGVAEAFPTCRLRVVLLCFVSLPSATYIIRTKMTPHVCLSKLAWSLPRDSLWTQCHDSEDYSLSHTWVQESFSSVILKRKGSLQLCFPSVPHGIHMWNWHRSQRCPDEILGGDKNGCSVLDSHFPSTPLLGTF